MSQRRGRFLDHDNDPHLVDVTWMVPTARGTPWAEAFLVSFPTCGVLVRRWHGSDVSAEAHVVQVVEGLCSISKDVGVLRLLGREEQGVLDFGEDPLGFWLRMRRLPNNHCCSTHASVMHLYAQDAIAL